MGVVTLLLCFSVARSTPELINWSVFINGLPADERNAFKAKFINFEDKGSVLNQTQIARGNDENENCEGSGALSPYYIEPMLLATVTKYLTELDNMLFRVVSSTTDSSIDNNCRKKCYVWTLQDDYTRQRRGT